MSDCTCNNFPASLGNVTFGEKIRVAGWGSDPASGTFAAFGYNTVDGDYPNSGMVTAYDWSGTGRKPVVIWGSNVVLRTDSAVAGIYLKSDGKVGIGTPAPAGNLEVASSATAPPMLRLNNTGTNGRSYELRSEVQAGLGRFKIVDVTSGGYEMMHIKSNTAVIFENGSVGIGTPNPGAKLHVVGGNILIGSGGTDADKVLHINTDDGDKEYYTSAGSLGHKLSSESGWILRLRAGPGTGVAGHFAINTGDGERLRIDGSGKVGIGTPTPSRLLQIHSTAGGPAAYLSSSAPGIAIGDNASFPSASGLGVVGLATAPDNYVSGSAAGDLAVTVNAGNILFGTGATQSAAGSEKMRITNNGKVGIGTTSPVSLLSVGSGSQFQVDSTGKIAAAAGIASGGAITFSGLSSGGVVHAQAGTGDLSLALVNLDSVSSEVTGTLPVANGGTGANSLTGVLKGNGASAFSAMTGAQNCVSRWVDANTLGTGALYDDGSKVGIGTPAPQSPLHIHSSSLDTDRRINLTDGTTGEGPDKGLALIKGGPAGDRQQGYLWNYSNAGLRFGTNNQERMAISSAGNVGIGLPANVLPASPLHIHAETADTDRRINLTDATTGAAADKGLALIKGGPAGDRQQGYLWNYSNAGLRFGTNNSERMVISSDGNVGIGLPPTVTPASPLHIHAQTADTDRRISLTDVTTGATANSGVALFKGGASGDRQQGWLWNYSNAGLHFGTNNAERVTILSNGNVGIGTNNPGYPLDVVGTARMNGISLGGNMLLNGAIMDSGGTHTRVDGGGCYYAS